MSEERIKLQLRKVKLLEAIEDTKKKKEKITLIVQSLVKELDSGIIRRGEYEEKLNAVLKNRTAEQWIKYYDDYIDYYNYQIKLCERLINESKKKEKLEEKKQREEKITIYRGWGDKTRKSKLAPILMILIGIVLIAIFISLFVDTGVVVKGFENIGKKAISIFEAAGEEEIVIGEGDIGEVVSPPQVEVSLDNELVEISDESLMQYQAVIGGLVKWKKQFSVDSITGFSVELPKGSENINIKIIEGGKEKDMTEFVDINKKRRFFIFGEKAVEVKLSKKSITGNAISDDLIEGKQVFEIIYETPAPVAEEEIIGESKRIIIKGPEEIYYENILSFTELPREFKKEDLGKLKLYQIQDGQRKELVKFTAYDTNEDDLFDFVEFIAPETGEYLLIIEISKAEHLDENKIFISDIYNEVYRLDEIWSEEIDDGDYVRVTFEQALDNTKDITIYPRVVSGNPRIEVYEGESDEIIAEFESLIEGKNTVYLTNLPEDYTQDVFDLKVVGGAVELDYIVDPIAPSSVATGSTAALTSGMSWNHNIPCGENMVLIVGISIDSEPTALVSSITYNGDFLSKIKSDSSSDDEEQAEMWNLTNPDCGDSYPINVVFSNPTAEEAAGISIVYYGADYIDASSVASSSSAGSTSSTLDVNSPSNKDWVVNVFALDVDAGLDISVFGDNAIQRGFVDQGDTTIALADGNDTDGTVTIGWSGFNDEWVQIGVSLIAEPVVKWNQSTLDLGENLVSSGNVTKILKISSFKPNTNVKIDCTGDCVEIITNWTTRTMSDGQIDNVLITCSNATQGVFQAVFNVTSDEDTLNNSLIVDCEIFSYGNLSVNLTYPPDGFSVIKDNLFDLNATVICSGGVNAKCGEVYAYARYNGGSATPDTDISITKGGIPFYISGSSGGGSMPVNSWSYDNLGENYGVAIDSNDNFIVVGTNATSWYIMKFNSNNENVFDWSKDFGGFNVAYSVATDSNNNFIVGGYNSSGWVIKKFDSNNNLIWNYSIDLGGGAIIYKAYSVATDSNNNFIVGGSNADGWYIKKFNSNNENVWDYSADLGGVNKVSSVATDLDNNFIVGGYNGSGWVIKKFNSNNENVWNYSANFGGDNGVSSVATDSDNNFIVGGYNGSGWVIKKFNSNNENVWDYNIDLGGRNRIEAIAIDSNNNFIVAGYNESVLYILGFDSNNNHIWNWSGHLKGVDIIKSIVVDSNNNFIVAGYNIDNEEGLIARFDVSSLLNPQSKILDLGEIWNATWKINATGTDNTLWKLGVFFNSSYGSLLVPDNHTQNVSVCIGTCEAVETNVTQCRNLDKANTVYTQTANIITGRNDNCINITAENITLDCQGYYIYLPNINEFGVYSNSSYTTIKNCNITMSSANGGIGIYLDRVNGSYIGNCVLNGQNTGLYLLYAMNNTINGSTLNLNNFGINFQYSSDNIINNITLISSGYGILMDYSHRNYFHNFFILNSVYNGINFPRSRNNFFEGGFIDESGANGIFSYSTATASNNLFKDIQIENSDGSDIFLTSVGSANLLNTTFLNVSYASEEGIDASGGPIEVIRKWYYQANVTANNAGVANANISAYNVTGIPAGWMFNLTSKSDGFTNITTITDYINNGTRNYYSLYTINTINGSLSESHDLNVTEKSLQAGFGGLILDNIVFDTIPPSIIFVPPTPQNGSSQFNNSIFVNVSASDVGKGDNNISTFIDFDNSLVGWWRMDDTNGSANSVVDYIGINNGTAQGNAIQTDSGKMGKGFEFDGKDDYIEVVDDDALDIPKALTISLWANIAPNPSASPEYLICAPNNFNTPYRLLYGAIPNNLYLFNDTANAEIARLTGFDLEGEWHHIVAGYNDSHDGFIYIDGVKQTNSATGLGTTDDDSGNFRIGNSLGATGDFNGTLDDVMIFNRSLSAEEIRGLYANTSSRYLTNNFTSLATGSHTFKAYTQDTFGNVNSTEKREVTISSGPKITWIQNIPDVDPSLGGMVNVNFNFTAYDGNGYTDLDDSSAKANFSKIGYEQVRENLTCSRIAGQSSGDYANYTCTIGMLYFDEGGDWNISIFIADDGGLFNINDSTTFKYNYLTAISIPFILNWGILAPEEVNRPVNGNPIIANNTGNVDILVISINATNLINETRFISVGNFSVNSSDGGGNGMLLVNKVELDIFNSSLASKNSTSSGERRLYFYIQEVPVLPSRVYSTDPLFPWIIGFAVLISVSGKKKKKKINVPLNIFSLEIAPAEVLCKYLRENKGLSVKEITRLIKRDKSTVSINYKNAVKNIKEEIEEVKGKIKGVTRRVKEDRSLFVDVNIFSNRRLSILESVVKYLKEKGYRNIEIARLLNKDQRNISTLYSRVQKKLTQKLEDKKILLVPITIFKQEISPAEALYRYLRESKKLRFSQIAELTNRSESTIWTEYHNSRNKINNKIKDEKTKIYVTANIFSNRRLSILESVVKYLKEKGYRNYKIAELLGKDQRNISTLYSRVQRKIN